MLYCLTSIETLKPFEPMNRELFKQLKPEFDALVLGWFRSKSGLLEEGEEPSIAVGPPSSPYVRIVDGKRRIEWERFPLPRDIDGKLAIPLTNLPIKLPGHCGIWRLITLGMLLRCAEEELLAFEMVGPTKTAMLVEFARAIGMRFGLTETIGPKERCAVLTSAPSEVFRSGTLHKDVFSKKYPTMRDLVAHSRQHVWDTVIEVAFSDKRDDLMNDILDTMRRAGLSFRGE